MDTKLPIPKFTLPDVKYADSAALYARAEKLFKGGCVGTISDIGLGQGYQATVSGSQPYAVWLSNRRVDEGDCTCYMGQNDELCKHILALALKVLDETGGLNTPAPPTDLAAVKVLVRDGVKKIKPYTGPSRVWFTYQRSLATGAGMIVEAVSALPPSKASAEYLWKLVVRLSKKLATGGVDDSDGVVGECISELVVQLAEYAKQSPDLQPHILRYCKDDTGFGFEDELRARIKK